jgi:hypothetical protein
MYDFVYLSVRRSVRDSHSSRDYRDGTRIQIFYENPGFYTIYDDNGGNVGAISAILPSWMGRTKEINTGSNLKIYTRSLDSTTNRAGSSG